MLTKLGVPLGASNKSPSSVPYQQGAQFLLHDIMRSLYREMTDDIMLCYV